MKNLTGIYQLNRKYFAQIWEDAAEIAQKVGRQTTVRDLLAAQKNKGNGLYVDVDDDFIPEAKQASFPSEGELFHQISHLSPGLGHTVPQEAIMHAFEQGLTLYNDNLHLPPEDMNSAKSRLKDVYQFNVDYAGRWIKKSAIERLNPPSPQSQSAYFAAGLYMRQKISYYLQETQPLPTLSVG